jgi:hypothetical protein
MAAAASLLPRAACASGDRMYFAGIVEQNADTLANQVVLEWGPLEQAIPAEVTGFRLYRRPVPGSFSLVEETQRGVADVGAITGLFEEPGEELRLADIQEWALNDSGGSATGPVVYAYLHDILSQTPGSPGYNPIRNLFLARMNADVSRTLGLAVIDRNALPPGNYEYMLTGLVGSTETLPLGKYKVDSSAVDLLPAPSGFDQAFLGGCSLIGKGLDDRQIHFRWDIPEDPESLRLKILTYGYDLYRSDTNLGLGPNDLRNMQMTGSFNPSLTKINVQPIIAAGQAPMEGKDSFLAVDSGDPANFYFLMRGKTYVYYLVARDLSGKYSRMAPAVEAMVPDSMAPPAPWGVRSEEIKDPFTPAIPRIQLVWDEINPPNYLHQFGTHRTLVTPPPYASPSELYYVPQGEPMLPMNYRDVDLDVDRYLVFRFASMEGAQTWGVDSDLDFWPDEIESASGTDKCDETSHPAGNPPELIAEIPFSSPASLRTLSDGSKQRFFVDTVPTNDNHVYWYRLIAVDQFGNQSPLSPPVRGVLWDRRQPDPEGAVTKRRCTYHVERNPNCLFGTNIRIRATDETRNEKAKTVMLYEVCGQVGTNGGGNGRLLFLAEKVLRDRQATFTTDELQEFCRSLCPGRTAGGGVYILRYYDARRRLIASSEPFTGDLCQFEGTDCFILKEFCEEGPVHPGEGLDPGDGVKVCVYLQPGERARVFHELNDKMTPLATINAPTDAVAAMVYCVTLDLTAIVPSGACLGVRVFSKNNVGSILKYLNCVTIPSGTPETPLMNSVDPAGTAFAPKFFVRWAAQSEGISAFVLSMKYNTSVRYMTYWVNSPDLTNNNGLYQVSIDLNPATDLGKNWCFKVRAVDNTLRSSGWSETLCNIWEPEPGDHLAWPPVPETPTGDGIKAYFLNVLKYPQPVLVLSDDLIGKVNLGNRCDITVPDCRQVTTGNSPPCLQPIPFSCTGLCDELKAANKYGKFIVYRQEETKGFVQVSPLIDTFFCYQEDHQDPGGPVFTNETLDDPFIFLAQPVAALILPPAIRPEVAGLRLIFADNYPCRSGSRIRYQVMVVDPSTGEGTAMSYSNWLDIP